MIVVIFLISTNLSSNELLSHYGWIISEELVTFFKACKKKIFLKRQFSYLKRNCERNWNPSLLSYLINSRDQDRALHGFHSAALSMADILSNHNPEPPSHNRCQNAARKAECEGVQKPLHSFVFLFLCLMRNKLSLLSSSVHFPFLGLLRLLSLRTFSSLSLWWRDLDSFRVAALLEELGFEPLGKSSSPSPCCWVHLCFSPSFFLVFSLWVFLCFWGHLLLFFEK